MKPTYVTVDLDYWNGLNWKNESDVSGHAVRFVRKVIALGVPISVHLEHHHILRELKDKKYDLLINIDYHDDYVILKSGSPCEGTWSGFVPFRKDAVFEWRMPNEETCYTDGYGLCDQMGSPWTEGSEWLCAAREEGLRDIRWQDVDQVSFILSPDHTLYNLAERAIRVLANEGNITCTSRVRRILNRCSRFEVPFPDEFYEESWCGARSAQYHYKRIERIRLKMAA